MGSEKLSYAGIAGAVAGAVAVIGSATTWYTVSVGDIGIAVRGTGVNAGRLALAMSIALFAFSVAYVVMDDARIRRAMAALVIVTSVTVTVSLLWGLKTTGDASIGRGLWLTGLGGILGIGAGLLAMKESPLGADVDDEAGHADPVAADTGASETPIAS